jgi:hypothetical protein
MFLIRGFVFPHEAVRDWEAKLAPLLAEGLRKRRAGKGAGTSMRPTSRSLAHGAGQSHMKNPVGGSTQRNPCSEQRNAPTRVLLRSGTLDPS